MFNFNLLLETDATANPGGNTMLFIIIAVFLVAMFAFSIIPQRKKQKKMLEMSSRIGVGDKIKTAGGIYGDIIGINEQNNAFIVKSGDTVLEVDRGFVYSMEMLGLSPQKDAADTAEIYQPQNDDNPEILEPISDEIPQTNETVSDEGAQQNGQNEAAKGDGELPH